MRFPLDVAFLDRELCPISIRRGVPSRRIVREPRASAVAEFPAGAALAAPAREVA